MDDKEKRPTSGFVAGFGGECGFSGAQHDSGFSNISEVYVSKSGFSRLLSAVRYGKRYMLKCLKPDFAFTPVYRQALMKEFEIGLQLDHLPHHKHGAGRKTWRVHRHGICRRRES